MPATQILGLLAVAMLLAAGQLLFKSAADRLVLGAGVPRLLGSFVSTPMVAALILYAGTTLLWVYLLHGAPLSRAYPFIAVSFALVPLMAWLVFGEPVSARYVLGLAIVLFGLYVVSLSN